MAKASTVPAGSPSDGMDGYVPSGGTLLDAEIAGDGSSLSGETPYGNSGLEEIPGDPVEEELPEEVEEEVEDDEAEEEEDGDPETDPVVSKKKADSYWQSKYDKIAAEAEKLRGLAGYEVVIKRLQEDPEAAKMLMEHWTRGPEVKKEPELVEPEPPEDFDMAMIGVRGSSSQKYWQEQQAYNREIARREAREEARRSTEEATRPLAEERAAARQREQLAAVLSKTDLPVDEYDAFTKWAPTPEEHAAILAKAYLERKGASTTTKVKVSEKAKEFAKVKENGEKAGAVKKVKGDTPAALTDEQGFMASLKAAAGTSRYKA